MIALTERATETKQPWLEPDRLTTTVSEVSCRNEFTRLQCVTQLTSSSAPHWDLVEHSTDCYRWSQRRVGATTTSLRQNEGPSLRALAVTNRLFRATIRYHTTTGSFQSYPHFILLTHKYMHSIHICMRRGIKIAAFKMQAVCIFFHICWISTENLIFDFPW